MDHKPTIAHITHEAIGKIGGIGAVLEGMFTSKAYLEATGRSVIISPLFSTEGTVQNRLGPDGQVYTLYIGSSPTYGAAHFRLDGQDEAYLTSDITPWEVSAVPSSWIVTSYLSRSADALTEVTLDNSNGSFVFVKDDEGAWTLADLAEDEELNATAVNSLVNQVTAVTLQTPLGKTEHPDYGLETPNAVVTLTGEDGSVTLTVGSMDPETGSYTVKSSDSEYYVTIASYYATVVVEGAREGFLDVPPTPLPDAE